MNMWTRSLETKQTDRRPVVHCNCAWCLLTYVPRDLYKPVPIVPNQVKTKTLTAGQSYNLGLKSPKQTDLWHSDCY